MGNGAQFGVVFGLIWLAWFNGTLWHELHGREDGQSRSNIFIQMGHIALLAVYTSHATDTDGPAFAIVYLFLFGWYTYQWWAVYRVDDPGYEQTTSQYLLAMVGTMIAIGVSIVVSDAARLLIWAAIVLFWVLGGILTLGGHRLVTNWKEPGAPGGLNTHDWPRTSFLEGAADTRAGSRLTHNPKVTGSNPVPATKTEGPESHQILGLCCFWLACREVNWSRMVTGAADFLVGIFHLRISNRSEVVNASSFNVRVAEAQGALVGLCGCCQSGWRACARAL